MTAGSECKDDEKEIGHTMTLQMQNVMQLALGFRYAAATCIYCVGTRILGIFMRARMTFSELPTNSNTDGNMKRLLSCPGPQISVQECKTKISRLKGRELGSQGHAAPAASHGLHKANGMTC